MRADCCVNIVVGEDTLGNGAGPLFAMGPVVVVVVPMAEEAIAG